MALRIALGLLLCAPLLACVHKPVFRPAGSGQLQLEAAPDWAFTAEADGALLSKDWLAAEAEHPAENSFAVRFKNATHDGRLTILSVPLAEEDLRKTLFTLSQRGLSMLRATLSQDGLSVSTRRAITVFPLEHAQAADAIYETWRPGDQSPVVRVYMAWIRPDAAPYYLGVWFEAPPGEFELGLPEIGELARRMVILHYGAAPETPAIPAPALPKGPPTPGDDPAPPGPH